MIFCIQRRKHLPTFLHPTHSASFLVPVVWMPLVASSISQTGLSDNISQTSCCPFVILHRLHSLFVRQKRSEGADGQLLFASEIHNSLYRYQI